MVLTFLTFTSILVKLQDQSGDMIYVLIIISMLHTGQAVTMQEFTSEKNCIAAMENIKKNSRYGGSATIYAACMEK